MYYYNNNNNCFIIIFHQTKLKKEEKKLEFFVYNLFQTVALYNYFVIKNKN